MRTLATRLVGLLLLTVFLSGCQFSGRWEWDWDFSDYNISGQAELDALGAPVVGAYVFFNGPVDRRVETTRSGKFQVYLPSGTYDVKVWTLHDDTYQTRMTVRENGVVDLTLRLKSWYQEKLFYALSGMTRYYMNGDYLDWDHQGELVRWEQKRVYVYFDTYNAPTWKAEDWAKMYLAYLRSTWESSILDGRITFERVFSSGQADIVVRWVEAGSLWPHGAITRHVRYHNNGSLDRVQIEIDEDYGSAKEIWAHELARAMGVGASYDKSSLMYPALESDQRIDLSPTEKRHIQLMYDVPSGLRHGTWVLGMAATSDGGEGGSALTEAPSSGFSGYVRTFDGRITEISESEAGDALYAW